MLISKKSFTLGPVDKKEVLRYSGAYKETSETLDSVVDECISLLNDVRSDVVYTECDVNVTETGVAFDDVFIESNDLKKLCAGKTKLVVFAATVGIGIDRLISKYGRLSPTRALIFQGIGAERVEALCDAFCETYSSRGATVRKSPGYGDIPLNIQRYIVRLLDTERKIGVSLNESMLLSPTKSVTAFFAID